MRRCPPLLAGLALACSSTVPPASVASRATPTMGFESAGAAAPRLPPVPGFSDLAGRIDSHFDVAGTHRVHVQLDRPLYRPGESVWVKTWTVKTADFAAGPSGFVTYELVNPRGQVVQTRQAPQQQGTATNDFVLPADAPGGRWTLRATQPAGERDERPFIVANYQAPRIHKELEFVREAYGPGDTVQALVELRKGTGEPLADHRVDVLLSVDGATVNEVTLRTNREGAVLATGTLPERLRTGDGLLTVLVEEGGVTESISRSVPILLADAQLAFFPEGGDLVEGLPARVYLESTNRHGEPADVEGFVTDDRGVRVANFATVHDGLGRFSFTPQPGRRYQAQVTVPKGLDQAFELPVAATEGCVLRSFDDPESIEASVRVAVRCTDDRDVVVAGVLREQTLDVASVRVKRNRPARVYLKPPEALADQAGAVRVTVFDTEKTPLAERVVYRNHGRTLQVGLSTDQETYGPRDEVVVDVTTRDPSGDPVPAEVALSVVDDKVITFADDENGHILTRLYLEPELVDSPDDPAFYFDSDEPLAPVAMDLLMGTKGYRRFDWMPVWNPPPPVESKAMLVLEEAGEVMMREEFAAGDMAEAAPVAVAAPPPVRRPAAPMQVPAVEPEPMPMEDEEFDLDVADDFQEANKVALAKDKSVDGLVRKRARRQQGPMMAGRLREDRMRNRAYLPVRVFPAPDYRDGFTGTRTDFRDTVHWAPTVKTGAKGTAQVRFYLSDATTAFRITAEGMGGGHAGRGEATITSVLPVSLATRLPPAVSVGDQLQLPLTVTSTRADSLDVEVGASFDSPLLTVGGGGDAQTKLRLAPMGVDTHFVPIDVGSGADTVALTLTAMGGGLSDTVVRELDIVPTGFPQAWTAAGEDATNAQTFELELTDVVDHSLQATVSWHPSPVSSLITGLEGMIRTPGGCFEQTSSSNWPNVAILRYLEAHDGDPKLRVQSARALDVGYGKLTGYQVDAGGFETWGSGPGKEALSAFGLLQFADMQKVYDVAPAVLDRDVSYLLAQRDGSGGYARTGESAHGYGSAPKAVLDGFITYALVETGHHDAIAAELDRQAKVAQTSDDPYVLALATRSLLKAGRPEGSRALERLVAMQAENGSFPGAASSITRSYEANLLVESTALAALAMMEGRERRGADLAVEWILGQRQGGTWGATQATALALGALTEHAEMTRVPATDGSVRLIVNGEPMAKRSYYADETEPIVFDDWGGILKRGHNTIVVEQTSGAALPFSVDVQWTSVTPATSPGAELALQTELAADAVKLGETVRLTTTIGNRLDRIVPSPIARIGLPAGLEAQTWQLEELQDRKVIAFFETRPREVTLYWDGIHPEETHTVALDLTATVAGRFTGPASAAYPYYNDDEKAWAAGTEVSITP